MRRRVQFTQRRVVGLVLRAAMLVGVPASAATLEVVSPNGGEVWTAGEWVTIEWSAFALPTEFVELWLWQNGEPYVHIATVRAAYGQFAWQVCDRVGNGAAYRLRIVCNSCDPPLEDLSDGDFTISGSSPPPTVTVVVPNGGEAWSAGTSLPITWTSTAPTGYVAVWLLDAGVPRELLGHVPMAAGELLWHTGAYLPANDDYSIRLTWYDRCGPAVSDASDGTFTIVPDQVAPIITLTRPNGGEVFLTDTSEAVTWQSTNATGEVQIWLTDVATRFEYLGTAPLAAGQFDWPILACTASGDACRILLRWAEGAGVVTDASDAPFTLTGTFDPTITITAPVGGAAWTAGQPQVITWTSDALLGEVDLDLLTGGPYLGRFPIAAGAAEIELCPGVGDGARTIRARFSACGVDAISDEFEITRSVTPTLTLLTPLGGEAWPAATAQVIAWESTGLSGMLDIFLPNDRWTQWGHVAVPIADGTYTWWVPPTLTWPQTQLPTSANGVWLWSSDCGPVLFTKGGTIQITPAIAPLGDFDVDSDVDLQDLAEIQRAFSGRGPVLLEPPADFFDGEPDADVDLDDAEVMLDGLTGPAAEGW